MDAVLNDKSINGQFTEEAFLEYLQQEIIPSLKLLDENTIALFKSYETYACMVTENASLQDFLTKRGDARITKLKAYLAKLFNEEPYWSEKPKTKTEANYSCSSGQAPNCMTEVLERGLLAGDSGKALLFSFLGAGFDEPKLPIQRDGKDYEIRNFCTATILKQHLSELGVIISWDLSKNSFVIYELGYKFEIRTREDNHGRAHFHLSNADESASISIPDADILAGSLKNSNKAISWSQNNMQRIKEMWNYYHEDKRVV